MLQPRSICIIVACYLAAINLIKANIKHELAVVMFDAHNSATRGLKCTFCAGPKPAEIERVASGRPSDIKKTMTNGSLYA